MSRSIVVTGGKEAGDHYTEAQAVGAATSIDKGVPAADIVEVGGDDCWAQPVRRPPPVLHGRGDDRC